MNISRSIMASLFCFVGISFLGIGSAHAEKPVELRVAVVHASKLPGKIDKAISKRMAKSLGTVFGQYKSFKLLSKDVSKMQVGKTVEIALSAKNKAIVKYNGRDKKKHKLTLSIPKHKVKMKLSAPAKKLFYQAGIRHKNGILILAFYLKE
jgi:hypothetical protein